MTWSWEENRFKNVFRKFFSIIYTFPIVTLLNKPILVKQNIESTFFKKANKLKRAGEGSLFISNFLLYRPFLRPYFGKWSTCHQQSWWGRYQWLQWCGFAQQIGCRFWKDPEQGGGYPTKPKGHRRGELQITDHLNSFTWEKSISKTLLSIKSCQRWAKCVRKVNLEDSISLSDELRTAEDYLCYSFLCSFLFFLLFSFIFVLYTVISLVWHVFDWEKVSSYVEPDAVISHKFAFYLIADHFITCWIELKLTAQQSNTHHCPPQNVQEYSSGSRERIVKLLSAKNSIQRSRYTFNSLTIQSASSDEHRDL